MESDAFAELMVRVVHYGSLGRCVLRFMCAKVVMRLETTTHGKVEKVKRCMNFKERSQNTVKICG